MKCKSLIVLVIFMSALLSVNGQTTKKLNPVGDWKFEAPTAEPGYGTGIITIGLAEKQHTATISFTGSEYKIPGQNVKLTGDSLSFKVVLESEEIVVLLRMESDSKMSGKAVPSMGDIPLTLTRQVPPSVK